MKTIIIKGSSYNLKYTIRAFFIFENLTGYPFCFGKVLDEYLLFYSMILANNEAFDLIFDEFINLCDEDSTLFAQFKEFFLAEVKKQSQDTSSVKKKTVRKK
ncbi:hypothetical protein HMPREF1214_03707 [Bacteroides sp. HPS0048]|uniref:hypothetical protein n=1 Tax=Bacteroides sp. HPS0048 TaxID=1078089 RepID=UPI00035D2147|nr:hypothetical protein [Bacteroides sp. HPS0048]EOA55584.1 hypothetical protein HMPREF1214_03707 [Bacteroides sp. HPS0048]